MTRVNGEAIAHRGLRGEISEESSGISRVAPHSLHTRWA